MKCWRGKVEAIPGPMDMMWGMWGSGMMVFGFLFWVLVIAALVAAVWWLLARQGLASSLTAGDRAVEILRERYARGEISREEFEARRKDLAA